MDKMPVYKGLERFKLIEKKGECAYYHTIHPGRLVDSVYLSAVVHFPTCIRPWTSHQGRMLLVCIYLLCLLPSRAMTDPLNFS